MSKYTITLHSDNVTHCDIDAGNNFRVAKKLLKQAAEEGLYNTNRDTAFLINTATREEIAGLQCDGQGNFFTIEV